MKNHILVSRLAEYLDPWHCFGGKKSQWKTNIERYVPASAYISETTGIRTPAYDWGRIRYFRDLFRSNSPVSAILLDCECHNSRVYPVPVMIDGWHRFAGAFAAKAHKLPVIFNGRLDLLRYLQGRRKTKPIY